MLTIAVVGQKGGSGKSTVVWALGNAALGRGKRVVMIETDPQGSTLDYVERAQARYPGIADRLMATVLRSSEAEEIDTILSELAEQGFDYCLIDTQGSHSELSRALMVMVDRIIIPAMPVEHVYRSQMATVAAYEEVRRLLLADDPDAFVPPCGILLNAFKANDRMNAEQAQAFELFTAHERTLPFFLPHRNGFQTLGSGKVIAQEIEATTDPRDWVRRDAHLRDLSEANAVLSAIEGMS